MIISILNNTILTITQSLVKSTKLINSNNVNFNDIQESNWDRVLQDNNTLSLLSLLNKIKETLELMQKYFPKATEELNTIIKNRII